MKMDYFRLAGDLIRQKAGELRMETKHTSTPWRLLDGAILSEELNAFGNFLIIEQLRRHPQDKTNAEFIVCAVNAYEELVKTLIELRVFCCDLAAAAIEVEAADLDCLDPRSWGETASRLQELACAALAQAKGE